MKTIGTEILPATRVERTKPVICPEQDAFLFEHELKKNIPPVFAYQFDNVKIWPNGYLIHPSMRLPLPEGFSTPPRGKRWIKNAIKTSLIGMRSRTGIKVQEPALFITDEFSNGYFHWIGDVLPRLELLVATRGIEALRSKRLVVPAMADFSYVRPSLDPYGLSGTLVLGNQEELLCDDLEVIGPCAPSGNYRPELMQALRERFRAWFKVSARPEKRLFISRIEAPMRRIANEAHLKQILDRYGFESVVLEDLPFAQQVALIGSASCIVGLHGAGLTNMLWMKEGCSVAELRFRGDSHNNCYFSLASDLGLAYQYLLVEKENPKANVHNADALVDPLALEQLLRNLC